MKIYKLKKYGSLFVTRCFVQGPYGKHFPRLLIDTGSTYTILAPEISESIGCSPTSFSRKVHIATASGYEFIPEVKVERFDCLGESLIPFSLFIHSMPFGSYLDGVLGMDFMTKFNFVFKTKSGQIFNAKDSNKILEDFGEYN